MDPIKELRYTGISVSSNKMILTTIGQDIVKPIPQQQFIKTDFWYRPHPSSSILCSSLSFWSVINIIKQPAIQKSACKYGQNWFFTAYIICSKNFLVAP